MNTPVTGLLLSVLLLLTLRLQELVDGCSCHPSHPQLEVCNSDVVIRALVTSKKLITTGFLPNDTMRYAVDQKKMYKGSETNNEITHLQTSSSTSTCGVELDVNKKYILTGSVGGHGDLDIGLCNWIAPWSDLSSTQKQNLKSKKYETGCSCNIVTCLRQPCAAAKENECVWTDMAIEHNTAGIQAKNNYCKNQDGNSCQWIGAGSARMNKNVFYSEP
uniref:metalloproteinase inhibitor 4.3 n=1 Tax=Pristiophorus japonicus TaxID=55135 RepID=UPI00398EB6A6